MTYTVVYGCAGSGRVVLVGDPCQLPPTVLSKAAEASMLAQSMFERLARGGWPVQLLQEQYRSHPAISAFPSRCVAGCCSAMSAAMAHTERLKAAGADARHLQQQRHPLLSPNEQLAGDVGWSLLHTSADLGGTVWSVSLAASVCPDCVRRYSSCRFFYQGKLLDGSGINAVSKGAPFHSKLAFGPMVVWDCQEGRERGGGSRGGGSLQNPAEAELAATLVAGAHNAAAAAQICWSV